GDAKCTLYSKAFYSCKALTEVELPLGVSKLINDVFEDCSNLAKVVVYNKSTNFTYSTGLDIFKNCSPDLVIHGLSGSKAQTYAEQNGYEFVEFATSGKLGENVEWSLINGVLSISGIGAIPDFESVDDAPWRYVLVDAKSISVKGGITAIGNNVFSGCTGVTEVHLAESVAKIGDYAFNGCTALERLIVLNKTVEFGENVFASCPASITIYGRSNSAAQTYASDNSYEFVVAYDFGTLSTGIIWHLKEDGTLRFTSAKVEMPNFTLEAPAPWSMYGDFIKTADLDYLLSAGDYAFYNCTKLERIYTCGYFKTVGKYAFAGCTSLQGINWVSPTLPPPQSGQSPKAVMGDSAFEGCTSLKNVSLPSSLSTMGNAAFRGCTALEKIAVYGSVSIGNEAFANCTSLECAKILVSRTAFGTDVFKNVPADFVMYVYTGSTAETYAEDNEHDCVPFISYGRCGENLEWVLYADNELVISGTGEMYDKEESYYHTWYSYGYKDSILKITIESGATTIGDYAFFGCSRVKSISIPDTVTSIGDHAFEGCKALTSVDIHKDVTAIGTASFKDCTALISVNVAEDNENYSDVNGVLYCGTELVCYPAAKKGAEFAVPDDIVSIGGYAFYGCGTLERVTLPKTVQTVAAGNFAQCEALVEVVILNKEIAIEGVMSGNEALTIYGFAGSTAETYANANSIAFVAIADEITNVNVTVGTDLTLNYYAKIWDSESEKLVVTADNKEFEIEGVYDEAVGLYKFSLFGLPPQGMTTLISAKLVRGEEELDVLADFSIRQYLDMLLTTKPDGMSNEKYEGLKTLIADMLEYGAAAQEYTGYATDSMANADVDGASSFVAPQANITSSVKTEVTGAEIVAVGVRFDYANKIFYHIVTDDISKVTLEVSGLTLTADDFEKIGSNKYIAYSGDILATQLDDKVTAVLKVDGQTAQTVEYSVASYVYVMHGETSEGEPTAMATLCMRLYTYGRSAAAYAAMN
ncbi:MAG: leucine-rich repeat protein, partial [Clostridia bacterium]|nr:leucine-rich repeat protein [Clostridia bacterium]